MHVPEGLLTTPVLAGGAVIAAGGIAIGLRAIDDRNIVKVAVLSSAFFVASLIHVPFGPASVHLIMNGLAGLLLGWAVFPAIAVALVLQAILFGFGGLTTLGVNTLIMALPGLVVYYLFAGLLARRNGRWAFSVGLFAGAAAIAFGGIILAVVLVTAGREFAAVAGPVLLAHVPVMIIEGCVTGWAVVFLRKVRPETFHTPAAAVPVEVQP